MAHWVQRLGTINVLFALVSFCYFIETINITILIGALQSIENMFQIPSQTSGTLSSANEIGYIPAVIIVAYLGSRGNRVRWIGAACLLISCASLLTASPHFFFGNSVTVTVNNTHRFRHVTEQDVILFESENNLTSELVATPIVDLAESNFRPYDASFWIRGDSLANLTRAATTPVFSCNPIVQKLRISLDEDRCAERRANSIALAILFAGVILTGVGHSVPWNLAIPLFDDYVKKKNVPLYMGFIQIVRVLGPTIGFVFAGLFNEIYFTFSEPPPGVASSDPSWISAWWFGFVLIFATLTIPSIFLFFFPTKYLRKVGESERVDDVIENPVIGARRFSIEESMPVFDKKADGKAPSGERGWHHFLVEVKAFFGSIWILLKCKIFMVMTVGRTIDAFAWGGIFSFWPKYMVHHYGISQSNASLVLAFTSMLAFAIGIVVGSVITRRFRIEGRNVSILLLVTYIISEACEVSQLGLGCETIYSQAGALAKQNDWNMTNACNQACFCGNATAHPVCSRNGTVYFSPCHAGCHSIASSGISQCSCIDVGDEVSPEWCPTNCIAMAALYLTLSCVDSFVFGLNITPGTLITMRSVPVDLRALALAFSTFVISLLSTFPSPIVYGMIIDDACIKWSNVCGVPGNCELYDAPRLRYGTHGFMCVLHGISALFCLWLVFLTKDLKLFDDKAAEKPDVRKPLTQKDDAHE